VPTVAIWQPDPGKDKPQSRRLRLVEVAQHLRPRNEGVMRPQDWALVLVRSFARYQCREHGAASAEIIRHTREPVFASVLFSPMPPPPESFEDLIATFGDLPR
jgi:hypothetical protein